MGSPDCLIRRRQGQGWLSVNEDGSVKCLIYSAVHTLGPLTAKTLHTEPAFIKEMVAKTAKTSKKVA